MSRWSAIAPQVWKPPAAAPRTTPAPLSIRTVRLPGDGPEDVLVDDDGSVLCGLLDGRVLRVTPDGGTIGTVANTGGRPLGLEWLPDHTLLVCDARRGLLQVDASGNVHELATEADGKPFVFCNNADVTADGTVYFTDSSERFGVDEWKADLLEHSMTGRLLRRTTDGSIHVVATGLSFPNGVALTTDESRLFVAETSTYRLLAMDLPDGTLSEVVALPGFPDNISTGSDGLIWVAIGSPREPILDFLLPRPPVLRKAAWALPDALQPKPKKVVTIQAYDATGRLVHDLRGKDPDFFMPTGVREHDGKVWLGSLRGDRLAVFDTPAAQA
jgi:sugar lactone lactonase YvrE